MPRVHSSRHPCDHNGCDTKIETKKLRRILIDRVLPAMTSLHVAVLLVDTQWS